MTHGTCVICGRRAQIVLERTTGVLGGANIFLGEAFCKAACLAEYLQRYPNGLGYTVLSEGGK